MSSYFDLPKPKVTYVTSAVTQRVSVPVFSSNGRVGLSLVTSDFPQSVAPQHLQRVAKALASPSLRLAADERHPVGGLVVCVCVREREGECVCVCVCV